MTQFLPTARLGRRLAGWLLALGCLLQLGGCGEKPEEAYQRLVFFARAGNQAAFLDGFTADSQKLIKALLGLRKAYGEQVDVRADPYLSIVLERVVSAVVEEKDVQIEGSTASEKRKVATLTVTDGKIQRTLTMVLLDDGWKIDAFALQDLWQDKNAYSRKE